MRRWGSTRLTTVIQGRWKKGPGGTFGTGPGILEGPQILKVPRVKKLVKGLKEQLLTGWRHTKSPLDRGRSQFSHFGVVNKSTKNFFDFFIVIASQTWTDQFQSSKKFAQKEKNLHAKTKNAK